MRYRVFTKTPLLDMAVRISVYTVLTCLIYHAFVEARENSISTEALKKTVMLHKGRKKPLGTFASFKLYEYSGRRSINGQSSIDWLASVLFTPDKTIDRKILLINSTAAAEAAGLIPVKKRRYSYSRVVEKYEKLKIMSRVFAGRPPEELEHFEKEIIRLTFNLTDYLQLQREFAHFLPHEDFKVTAPDVKKRLNLSADRDIYSLFELLSRDAIINAAVDSLNIKKTELLTDGDKKMLKIDSTLKSYSERKNRGIVKIIPFFDQGRENWYSPSGAAGLYGKMRDNDSAMIILQKIVNSYRSGQQEEFDRYVNDYNAFLRERWSTKIELPRPESELIYNSVNPFLKAKIFYGVSLIFIVIILTVVYRWWIYWTALLLLSSGFLFHTFGLILRFLITERPPVTNMYETFVFTAWAGVILGAAVEYTLRRAAGLLTAAAGGFFFLYIAGRYSLESDTMGMLSAVLNSNFWLSSHIITIILGYTGCLCAGILGHVYLVRSTFLRKDLKDETLFKLICLVFSFGLFFTVTGTLLGGMWADQSWGRFWGWDPKENGALLIILWCLILFHAKAGRMIGAFGFAAGSVFTVVVVMFAWIGVNLLGVGLHSYGFTDRGFIILVMVTIFEGLFLFSVFTLNYLKTGNIKRKKT